MQRGLPVGVSAFVGREHERAKVADLVTDARVVTLTGSGGGGKTRLAVEVAAGLTELLRSLPANHPRRAKIFAGYQKMMQALLPLQGQDGLWRQLLNVQEAWPETSSTAMFTFAMATGGKEGWLEEKAYARAARKGWLGLVTYIEPNGDLRNVCEGTGKKNDFDYYLQRKRLTGDMHGQAPLLWCATAFLR